jgi:hypothetical protein
MIQSCKKVRNVNQIKYLLLLCKTYHIEIIIIESYNKYENHTSYMKRYKIKIIESYIETHKMKMIQ